MKRVFHKAFGRRRSLTRYVPVSFSGMIAIHKGREVAVASGGEHAREETQVLRTKIALLVLLRFAEQSLNLSPILKSADFAISLWGM